MFNNKVQHASQYLPQVKNQSLIPNAADTIIGGQPIPKGTQIYYYSGTVHHTESIFKNHSQFQPERFLDDEGVFSPDQRVLYFGTGKRRYERYIVPLGRGYQ